MGPRRIGEIIGGYTSEQRELLFDYFTRAAEAFQHQSMKSPNTIATPADGLCRRLL